MLNIKNLVGVNHEQMRNLKKVGVTSFEKLLEATSSKKDRE
jgi:predicted RecB family nuclease